MYPHGELVELAERKRLLQARIDVHRWECAAAAAELSRPIAMIDRGVATWRRISPFAKLLGIPAGIFLTRFLKKKSEREGDPEARKKSKVAAVLTALPVILKGVKLVG